MPNLIEDLTAAGLDPKLAEEIAKNEKVAPVLNNWRENGLRQSDYDRKFNLSKAEISAEKERLAEQKVAFDKDKQRMTNEFLEAQRQREQADMLNAQAISRAKTASAVYGVDLVKEVFGDVDPTKLTTPPPQQHTPPPGTISKDQFEQRIDEMEALFGSVPKLTVELQDVALRHAKLFPDKPLVLREIYEGAVQRRMKPMEYWDNLMGATAKEKEIEADRYRAEGAAAARAKWDEEQGKKAASPFGIQAPMSPIFAAGQNKTIPTPADRARGQAEAIQRAVQALAEHKYAPGFNTRREA